MTVGERVRAWRVANAYGVRHLARLADLDEVTLRRIEDGTRQPRIGTIRKLAAAMGLWPEELQA